MIKQKIVDSYRIHIRPSSRTTISNAKSQGGTMNEALIDPLDGYAGVTLALAFAGTAAGVLRAFITHRTRLNDEREASVRAATRMAAVIGAHHDFVRFVERDRDGHREVELGGHGTVIRDD